MLVVPQFVGAAASDLVGLGSTISEAQTAAAASTSAIAPAASDEVSAAIAALFSAQSREFQTLSARAQEFHAQLVRALTGAAGAYRATEAANAAALTAAGKGDPLRAAGKIIVDVAKKIIPETVGQVAQKLDELGPKKTSLFDKIPRIRVPDEHKPWVHERRAQVTAFKAGLAADAVRAQKILNNGVKFIAQDGATLFTTDGKAWVKAGSDFYHRPLLQLPLDRARQVGETAQQYEENTNRIIANSLQLDVKTVRDLWGSEYHVFARGEGLAQSYFQKTGNQIYQIDVDAAGRIIRKVESTARIFARWQSMTIGPRAPWALLR
jgi:hypothetical protein